MKRSDESEQKAPRSTRPPQYGSDELLGESRQAEILHRGERYILRETRSGKLILYK